jgi:hypothetical protein
VGRDHATVLRAQGFHQAGLPDPLLVRAAMEGLVPWESVPAGNSLLTADLINDIQERRLRLNALAQDQLQEASA